MVPLIEQHRKANDTVGKGKKENKMGKKQCIHKKKAIKALC